MGIEKSAAARNEKVRHDIPDDLSFFILLKLPLKSLKRFSSVCKSRALFFKTPYFMSMFCKNFLSNNHSFYDDRSLLLHQVIISDPENIYDGEKYVLHSLSGEKYENKEKIDWPNPFNEDDPAFNILGSSSINGMFCLVSYSQWRFVLWNPATKEFKVIPRSLHEFVPDIDFDAGGVRFGYDCVSDDYKLIQRVKYYLENNSGITDFHDFCEIYSLRSNSWRIQNDDIPNYVEEGVYMDGVYHWWVESDEASEGYLVSFDLSNEVFITTPIPSDEDDSLDLGFVWRHLAVLSGSIALISNYEGITTFNISIFGELGVKESWTKLFTIGPFPCIDNAFGPGKKGDIVFIKKDGRLASIDLSRQRIEDIDIEVKKYCCKVVFYKRSLLPIGEIYIP